MDIAVVYCFYACFLTVFYKSKKHVSYVFLAQINVFLISMEIE